MCVLYYYLLLCRHLGCKNLNLNGEMPNCFVDLFYSILKDLSWSYNLHGKQSFEMFKNQQNQLFQSSKAFH